MVYVDAQACWAANLLFYTAGFWAALAAANGVRLRRYRPLLWLLPVAALAAWLESAFSPEVIRHAASGGAGLPALSSHAGWDLAKWAVVAALGVAARYAKSPLAQA